MCQSPFSSVLSFIRSCGSGARVGIVGSRSYSSSWLVRSFVAGLPVGSVVVSGASGAVDLAAVSQAVLSGLGFQEFPAAWQRYGRAAGPLRNRQLVQSGLCCLVVFLSSVSHPSAGSFHVMQVARAAGVPVFIFGPAGDFVGPWFNDLRLALEYSL